MDRNTLLAFALSMIVFMTYVMYQEQRRAEFEAQQAELAESDSTQVPTAESGMPDRSVAAEPGVGAEAPAATGTAEASGAGRSTIGREVPGARAPAWSPKRIAPQSTTLRNENVIAKLSNGPGLIESWTLRDFMERLPTGDVPIELLDVDTAVLAIDVLGLPGTSFTDSYFEVVSESEREVVQRAESAAGILTRTFRLDRRGYGFDLELEFTSRRSDAVDARFEIQIPATVSQRDDFRELALVAYGEDEGVTRTLVPGVGQGGFLGFGKSEDGRERVEGRSTWAGFDVQYFAGLVIDPQARLDVEFVSLEAGERARLRATLPGVAIGAGGNVRESLRGFFGPKTVDALASERAGLEHSVDRGWSWLEPLTRLFEIALDKLYAIIPNYGLAIIVLTILVRVVTAPLMVRQMKSAERMREVQPKLKDLQERYKDDRQKQSEEMMKLYREEGINPLGGCLPLLLQMPVLIGLFYALRSSIGLRHAPFFGWINDLSQPATLFTIPGIDFPIRLLPIIMGASMYVQQKMMPQTGMDPVQARMMLVMMPGMMLLISYTFPSGLVLYWTVSNLLGIAHQYWVRKNLQPQS